jgi:sugar lactone lactonase YvrE
MHRFLLVLSLVACGLPLFAQDDPSAATADPPPPLEVVWTLTEGLSAPESAYYDAATDTFFLSQIGEGGGAAKDGDGFISLITLAGEVTELKWATGLNAPKGLRGHGGILWVSDIDRVVGFEMATGALHREVVIPEAKFLNDLATGPDGAVYVSDMVASRVYRIVDGESQVFLEGEEIQHPNGLLVDRDDLILGGWGKEFNDDFSTNIPGQLLRVNLETKVMSVITPEPFGNLDGIEADGAGGYLVTDWRAGKVFHVNKAGAPTLIYSGPRGTADHAYLPDLQLFILPEMLVPKLTAFRFAPPQ